MPKHPVKRARDETSATASSTPDSLHPAPTPRGAAVPPVAAAAAAPPDAELSFSLSADRRSNLSPADIANLALWCLPHPLHDGNANDPVIPAVECPRWLMVRNKSSVECVVVICCDGISYEDLSVVAASSASSGPSESQLTEAQSAALLSAVRTNRYGAAHVAFAPLWIRNTRDRLTEEFFMRNGHSKQQLLRQTGGGGSASMSSAAGTGTSCSGVMQAMRKSRAAGKTASPPPSPAAAADAGPSTAATAAADESPADDDDGVASPSAISHRRRRFASHATLLDEMTLTIPRDAAQLTAMGYVVAVPPRADADLPPGEAPWVTLQPWSAADAAGTLPQQQQLPAWVYGTDVQAESDTPKDEPVRIVAFDCEMVECNGDRVNLALARATLLDAATGTVLFDRLVRPHGPVTDYLTRYSGITEEMLLTATTTVEEIQAALLHHLGCCGTPDTTTATTYLIGHSLENDLRACRLVLGPTVRILDTVHLFPHPQGLPYKNALRHLALVHLQKRIQSGSHCSAEDAAVCVELLWLKLRHGVHYGATPRISILSLVPTSPATQQPHATFILVDAPEVLRVLLGNGCPPAIRGSSKVVAEGVCGDDVAAKKAARALRAFDAKDVAQRPRFVWVRLTDMKPAQVKTAAAAAAAAASGGSVTPGGGASTAAPHTEGGGDDDAESGPDVSLLDSAITRTNDAVHSIITSAPLQSLIVVLAGRCLRGDGNSLSPAHGMVYAFIKSRQVGAEEAKQAAACAQT